MRIMLSSVGGDLAQNVINCIKKMNGDNFLLGSDVNSRNSGRNFVDYFIESKLVSDSSYLQWLDGVFKEFKIDFYFPLSEAEIKFFAGIDSGSFNRIFENVKLIGVDRKIVNIFSDKFETQNWLKKEGFQTPKIFSSIDEEGLFYPIIIKPRFGSGSRNVFKCQNKIELSSAYNLIPEPIIQECVGSDSDEFTIGLYANQEKIKVISFRRALSNSGATSWARHEVNELFVEIGIKIAKKLQLDGSINIQLRVHEGKPYIFEINPRFSSTVFIRSELGFNDVAWSLGDKSTFEEFDNLSGSNEEFATYVKTTRLE
jgi:carbamoyl-phosphate synthase large subunit